MRHKIKIRKAPCTPLWYVSCTCGWEIGDEDLAGPYYGRPSQEQALAVGIAHQKNNIERCRCDCR